MPPEEYRVYRRWFELSLSIIWQIPHDLMARANPMDAIVKAEEKSFAAGVKSLTLGINDTLGSSADFTDAEVLRADEEFKARGSLPLSTVRARFSKYVVKPLKTDTIENEDEYYALKALLSSELPGNEIDRIQHLLADYENKLRRD